MHDWILRSIAIDWVKCSATIELINGDSNSDAIECQGLIFLQVAREEPWGPSVSVNEVIGPELLSNGFTKVCLEMQSGDLVEIVARIISLPNDSNRQAVKSEAKP